MNHLNYEFDASEGDVAEVTPDRAANVLLLDPLAALSIGPAPAGCRTQPERAGQFS
jgi:hypothetical protein